MFEGAPGFDSPSASVFEVPVHSDEIGVRSATRQATDLYPRRVRTDYPGLRRM